MNNIKNPVLGAIIGDIVGVPYEWYCKHNLQIPENFKLFTDESHFSDDTVMTIAVAEWLLDPPYMKNKLVELMQKWGRRYRKAGYGYLFGKWLDSENPQPYGSFGNGSAMRVSPVGCAFRTLETTLGVAKQSAIVSHDHPEGIKGAQCIASMIAAIRFGMDIDIIVRLATERYGKKSIVRSPQEIIKSGYRFDSTCQGSVPEAICCFLNSSSYEETIRNAIILRGDADTQAAIAGSLAAAYWGIPRDIANEGLEKLPDDIYYILEKFSETYNLEL